MAVGPDSLLVSNAPVPSGLGINMSSNVNGSDRYAATRKEYIENLYLENLSIGKINPYIASNASNACGIDSNTYIGSDVIYGANSRSLMRQFSANSILQRCENIFL